MTQKEKKPKFLSDNFPSLSDIDSLSTGELAWIIKNYYNQQKLVESDKTIQDFYSKIVDELGVPRPIVRRVARDLRAELLQKIQILQSDMPTLIEELGKEKRLLSSNVINNESQKPKRELKPMIIGTETSEFTQNKMTFKKLKPELLKDPDYVGKYVAIVKNDIFDTGSSDTKLARKVYDECGYVPMFVGLVSTKPKKTKIPSVLGVK